MTLGVERRAERAARIEKFRGVSKLAGRLVLELCGSLRSKVILTLFWNYERRVSGEQDYRYPFNCSVVSSMKSWSGFSFFVSSYIEVKQCIASKTLLLGRLPNLVSIK